ncbi:MAG: NAD-dependent epimerase/dehydratase family protein [Burkholderiaceae bacterium]
MEMTQEKVKPNNRYAAADVVEQDLNYICEGLKSEFADLKGKRMLIIGGAGFLGYYLVQAILHFNKSQVPKDQAELIVYDNFIRGVPQWLTALEGSPKFTLGKHDVVDPLPVGVGDLDYIVHAASIASPTFYRKYPIETMDANVNGLRNVLEYALAQKNAGKPMSGILFYSTSEIYGDPGPQDIPTPETYRGNVSCTGPRACYDESKRYGETLCTNFAQQHAIPVRIARPFNNYGPGLKLTDARVLPDFVRDVLADRDIVMLSDGSPTRTFCYIADAIVGYYKILFKGRNGEAYNIGIETPEISMRELADRVVAESADLFGYQGKVVMKNSGDKDYLVDNPNRRSPIIEKARSELGYNPSIDVNEGLRRALIWYQDNQETVEA